MSFEQVMDILNKPIVITALGALVLYGLNRLYAKKPGWAKYEGSLISAVKFAEKKIPDDTENKGLAKLNSALQYMVTVYEQTQGKKPSEKVKAELMEGLQLTHDKLEAQGTLKK